MLPQGKWATKYHVNYIFYRNSSESDLKVLTDAMGTEMKFNTFHHLNNATSPRLRGIFKDNPNLEYVLILQ